VFIMRKGAMNLCEVEINGRDLQGSCKEEITPLKERINKLKDLLCREGLRNIPGEVPGEVSCNPNGPLGGDGGSHGKMNDLPPLGSDLRPLPCTRTMDGFWYCPGCKKPQATSSPGGYPGEVPGAGTSGPTLGGGASPETIKIPGAGT